MTHVYKIRGDGTSEALPPVRSKNEDRDLQALLEKNYDLLPGDQIDPDEPRRWLLVKREMPVPDPATGSDRWSIDFFFVDQFGVPTFVECKRFADTRSRREIVGQMIEYAANGHHYWGKELLRQLADATAIQKGSTLDQALEALRIDEAYTEQARMVKRSVTVTTPSERRRWDRESFFEDATSKLAQAELAAAVQLLDGALELGCEITWGTGKLNGSYNVKHPQLAQRSLCTLYSNGELYLNFGWLNENPREEEVRERFKELVSDRVGLRVPDNYLRRHVVIPLREWVPKSGSFLQMLEQLVTEFREGAA